MSGAAINLRDVAKRFETDAGPVRALDGVSLDVPPGASIAITGPSGCGKSTLLSIVGALESPSAGAVEVAGRSITGMGEDERAALRRELIGFVFQSDNLQPFLTAVENISFQLALSGATDGYERSLALLASLGLERHSDKYPDQMSGGERQRVAVARALVHRPDLILADEPTGSLDTDNSLVVVDLLREAQAEVDATLIVITHDPAVAARLDRRVRLADGRIAADSQQTAPTAGVAAAVGN